MNLSFPNKTVLVTGAAHGIGRAMCMAFAERGAKVFALDILQDELQETQAACQAVGGVCESRLLDVRHRENVREVIGEIVAQCGADVFVGSAGGVLGYVGKPMEEVSADEWNDILAVNLTGNFWVAQAIVPHMKAQRFGRILTISSGAGLNISLTGIQSYATAKAGVIHLTRQLAHELGQFGITVNSIAPGFVRSNPNTERQWQSYGEAGQQALVNNIAMRRLGTPEDITHAALFLASDYAGWITGQVLAVDGGK
jgi:3-oxoacyl-[acyl-carrier protein] reductase